MLKNSQETQVIEKELILLSNARKKDKIIALLTEKPEGFEGEVAKLKDEVKLALSKLDSIYQKEENLDINIPNPRFPKEENKKIKKKEAKLEYLKKKMLLDAEKIKIELDQESIKTDIRRKKNDNYINSFITILLSVALISCIYFIYIGYMWGFLAFSFLITILAGRGNSRRNFLINFPNGGKIESNVNNTLKDNHQNKK